MWMLKILRKGFRFTCLSLMQFTHLGRAMAERMFIEILAYRAGYEVNFSEVTAEEMIEASYQSFNQNYDSMNAIMRRITIPKE